MSGIVQYVKRHRVLSVVIGTIFVQLLLIGAGYSIKNFGDTASFVHPASSGEYENARGRFKEHEGIITSLQTEVFEQDEDGVQSDLPLTEEAPAEDAIPDVRVVKHKVRSGETLTIIWTKYKASYKGALQAASAFKKAGVPLKAIQVGETLELQINSSGDITGVKKILEEGKILLLDGNAEDGYEARIIEPKVTENERTASGTIHSTFAEAATSQNVPYEVVDQIVDLFGGSIEFSRDMRPGDSFSVVYQERLTEDGKELAPGYIKAASIRNQGELVVAVRHEDKNGEEHFFDEKGEPLGNYFLRYPLKFTRISSVFNKSRFHPVLKTRRAHNGVDFAAPRGTPVRSVADGVITNRYYCKAGGNTLKVKHSDRYSTAYVHLNGFAKGIKNGTKVKRGQLIGYVGSTGLATGPHLHFSFYINGKYTDPLKVELPQMPKKFDPIPADYLKAVIASLVKEHSELEFARNKDQKSVS